jgi:hypothetical protein
LKIMVKENKHWKFIFLFNVYYKSIAIILVIKERIMLIWMETTFKNIFAIKKINRSSCC